MHNNAYSRFTAGLAAVCAFLIPLGAILWNADLHTRLGFAILNEQFLAVMLGLAIGLCFLKYRARGAPNGAPPIYDLALAIVGLVTLGFTAFNYVWVLDVLADRPPLLVAVGGITVVMVMEGLRRSTGNVLFLLIGAFVIYALVADKVPGALVGRAIPPAQLVQYLGVDPSAVFSSPLRVASTIVALFVFFGTLLFKAGGGEFFTDLALATTGRSRGAAAKISVVASALFGSISGSAVSNVATTGVITIPLMRRSGYSNTDAGAIESIASTGGQLTPPIMGAAAFLMAEFLEFSYTIVVVGAILPAILYYISVFIQIDLIAARDKIAFVEQDRKTLTAVLRDGWHLILPFFVLIYGLFGLNLEAEVAALLSALTIVVVGVLRPYGGQRLRLPDIKDAFIETGNSMVELLLIVAGAGFVIGILNITGLGFALTLLLVSSIGQSMLILLLTSAVVCMVLGMGMPTSGVYVLLAALIAPAIVESGIDPLASHMFIFYFGMMSMITPPIALAAFAAATISGANAMRTGFSAMRFGWVAYLIPFMFVLSPTLLGEGSLSDIAIDIARALAGILVVSAALVGYFGQQLGLAARVILGALGLLCLPFGEPAGLWMWINGGAIVVSLVSLGALLWVAREAKPQH